MCVTYFYYTQCTNVKRMEIHLFIQLLMEFVKFSLLAPFFIMIESDFMARNLNVVRVILWECCIDLISIACG
jgi:hypothetical protein